MSLAQGHLLCFPLSNIYTYFKEYVNIAELGACYNLRNGKTAKQCQYSAAIWASMWKLGLWDRGVWKVDQIKFVTLLFPLPFFGIFFVFEYFNTCSFFSFKKYSKRRTKLT